MNKPLFTAIPNDILDCMSELSPAEFKALMAIYRLIIGYEKYRESRRRPLSLSYLIKFTGLSKQGVINALGTLVEKGHISKVETEGTNEWVVNSVDYPKEENSQPSGQVVNSVDQGSQLSVPEGSTDLTGGSQLSRPIKRKNKRKLKKVPKESGSSGRRPSHRQPPKDDPIPALHYTEKAVFKVYEDNFGGLTPIISDEISAAIANYSAQWVSDALIESVKNNVRKWSYTKSILERWGVEGRGNQRPSKNGRSPSPTPSSPPQETAAEKAARIRKLAKEQK